MYANESTFSRLLKQFLFSPMELLLLVTLNGVLLLYVFFVLIVNYSPTGDEFNAFADIYIIGSIVGWIRSLVVTIVTADVATMLLWGVIGSFVYSFITAVQLLFSDARSTYKIAFTYVHPKGYDKKDFIVQMILGRIVSIILVFIMVLYVWAFCIVLIPYLYNGVKSSIDGLSLDSFRSAIYFVVFTLAMHVLFVLLRIESGRYKPDRL